MKNKLSMDPSPEFTKDAIDLLKKISETDSKQEKLFEIVKKLSEYYMKGKRYDIQSEENH
jgi:HEPN domain-containing protein